MELTYDTRLIAKWEVDWLIDFCGNQDRHLYGQAEDRVRRMIGHMERIRSSSQWASIGVQDKQDRVLTRRQKSAIRKRAQKRRENELRKSGFRPLHLIAKSNACTSTMVVGKYLRENPGVTLSEISHGLKTNTVKKVCSALRELRRNGRAEFREKRKCRITGAFAREWFPI